MVTLRMQKSNNKSYKMPVMRLLSFSFLFRCLNISGNNLSTDIAKDISSSPFIMPVSGELNYQTPQTEAQTASVTYCNWNSSCDIAFIDIISCVTQYLVRDFFHLAFTLFKTCGVRMCLIQFSDPALDMEFPPPPQYFFFSRVSNTKQPTSFHPFLAVLMGHYFTGADQQNKNVIVKCPN